MNSSNQSLIVVGLAGLLILLATACGSDPASDGDGSNDVDSAAVNDMVRSLDLATDMGSPDVVATDALVDDVFADDLEGETSGAEDSSDEPGEDSGDAAPDIGLDTDGDGLSDAEEILHGTSNDDFDTDDDGLSDGYEVAAGTDPLDPDSDDDGILDGGEVLVGTDPNVDDVACAADQYMAGVEDNPIDVIFIVDNSFSMVDEIYAVQENINEHFASRLEEAGLDYRVVMLSRYADACDEGVCITAPLSSAVQWTEDLNEGETGAWCPPATCGEVDNPQCLGVSPVCDVDGGQNCGFVCFDANCSEISDEPGNVEGRYFHYVNQIVENPSSGNPISSNNSLTRIVSTYGLEDSWAHFLRDDSLKVFIEVTDDGPREGDVQFGGDPHLLADTFDAALLALENPNGGPAHFGVPGARNYIFYSIIDIYPTDDSIEILEDGSVTGAYFPDDPLVEELCRCQDGTSGGRDPGTEYQLLSILTNGLRFPLCDLASFDATFQILARDVISAARLRCELNYPEPAEGRSLEPDRVYLQYTPGDESPARPVLRVDDPESCEGDAFYTHDGLIFLCDDLCDEVSVDETGSLDIVMACTEAPTSCIAEPEDCFDGIDNDCDKFIDSQDFDCWAKD